ncbi:MAG: hypothetical protein VZR00_07555 [Lachnospiraceae bacterium]|nr:hypothetical protein [Lachnospiraceae bacterium]
MKLAKEKVQNLLSLKFLIPSILAVGLIPLIARVHIYDSHLEDYDWFPSAGKQADVFLFYKQWAVVVLAAICVILLLIRVNEYYEELPVRKFMIPAGIYGIMVLVSAIFGKNPLLAFAGSYEMFESALALIGYLIIAYYTYTCMVSLKHVLYFLRGSEYFILVELAIAAFQKLGLDIFSTAFWKRLITPLSLSQYIGSINITADTKSAYGTIYNVDYFSMYLGVLVPIFIALIFTEEKLWRKILNLGLCGLAVLVMSHGATSGVVGIVGATVIGLFVSLSHSKKTFIVSIIALGAAIVSSVFAISTNSTLKNKAYQALSPRGPFVKDEGIPISEDGIYTGDKNVKISMKDGRVLVFSYSVDSSSGTITFYAQDGDRQPLSMECTNEEAQTYALTDDGWTDISFGKDENAVYVNIPSNYGYDGRFPFVKASDEGDYYFVNLAGKGVKLPVDNPVEVSYVFPENILTERGHLFNRCIPLLKHHMIIGAGANCFILVYPQWEYINKQYWYAFDGAALDVKPHCYYLQLWIENGFIAFAGAMVFFFWFLVQSIRLYRRAVFKDAYAGIKEEERKEKLALARIGFGIFTGVLAYLIVVLANDSTICTAPIFWTVLGAGWGVNALVRKNLGGAEEKRPTINAKKR